MSEATKFSPSPSPSTSGVAVLAATSLSGSVSESTTIENDPRNSSTVWRTASVKPQAGAHPFLDEMRDEFGVGLGAQLMAAPGQRGAQLDVVLDDTVVDYRDRARLVRMGIALRGAAMRRPSRMADSDRSLKRRAVERAAQVLELADRAADFHPGAVDRRHAGRVVAAILQPRERAEQNRHRLGRAHVSDYSAHADSTFPGLP